MKCTVQGLLAITNSMKLLDQIDSVGLAHDCFKEIDENNDQCLTYEEFENW